jgi:hypothetical protein
LKNSVTAGSNVGKTFWKNPWEQEKNPYLKGPNFSITASEPQERKPFSDSAKRTSNKLAKKSPGINRGGKIQ